MFVKSLVSNFTNVLFERIHISNKKKYEVRKFNDPRRKSIISNVILTDKQKKEIDEYFVENYGEKIPYIWHRHCMAFGADFNVKFFPEYLLIPEFEYYMNLWHDYVGAFEDKNVLPILAKSAGIEMPHTIISCTKGLMRDSDYRVLLKDQSFNCIRNIGEVFIKPTTETSSGRGCIVANIRDGIDQLSGKRITTILESYGLDYVLQERVICNDSIRRIFNRSVNTFRVVTYRWRDEICYWPSIMRIGQGDSVIDNAHAGGMFIGIDNKGYLKEKAITEFKNEYSFHPDTNVRFKGYQIDGFHDVLIAAKKMHELIPQIGIVSWDFTINYNNCPVLIEANLRNHSIWLSQLANQTPAFGEKTDEVLRWIKKMKKTKKEDRCRYLFGC